MHTSTLLKTGEFTYAHGTEGTSLNDILPGLCPDDRIGIVSASPGDSLRAAPLLLASIGAYYESLWAVEDEDFFLYPDYFVFHIGDLTAYHSPFDIWPQSKEVIVPPDPQELLAAINDRGITRLILPEATGVDGTLMEHAVQLAERRIRTIVRLAATEETPQWTVTPSDAAAKMIKRCARVSEEILGAERTAHWIDVPGAAQGYVPVDFEEALTRLCAIGTSHPNLGFSDTYRAAASISDAILARDIRRISVQ